MHLGAMESVRESEVRACIASGCELTGARRRWWVERHRHPAPHKQYVVCLDGGVQIEVSKPAGDKRVFQPGSVFYVEDVHGRGHKSSSVNGQVRRSIFIQADDG